MSVKSVRRMAASMLKVGETRIRVSDQKAVEEALTREDVRNLINSGTVRSIQKKGTSGKYSGKILIQKRKRRRAGHGNRRGTKKARTPKKAEWIKGVRAMRRLLRQLKAQGSIDGKTYTKFYVRVKGGEFRNKKHVLLYLKEHDLMKKATKEARTKARQQTAARPIKQKRTPKAPKKKGEDK